MVDDEVQSEDPEPDLLMTLRVADRAIRDSMAWAVEPEIDAEMLRCIVDAWGAVGKAIELAKSRKPRTRQ